MAPRAMAVLGMLLLCMAATTAAERVLMQSAYPAHVVPIYQAALQQPCVAWLADKTCMQQQQPCRGWVVG